MIVGNVTCLRVFSRSLSRPQSRTHNRSHSSAFARYGETMFVESSTVFGSGPSLRKFPSWEHLKLAARSENLEIYFVFDFNSSARYEIKIMGILYYTLNLGDFWEVSFHIM